MTECVSVTPLGGRAQYFGTVLLSDVTFKIYNSGLERSRATQVRNVHAWAVGNVVALKLQQVGPVYPGELVKVTYHFNIGRFLTVESDPGRVVDVTDGRFEGAWFVGKDFYVTKEW